MEPFKMAHEIEKFDGAVYGSGKAAWHGLGTVIEGTASAEEAIDLANLGWDVALEELLLRIGDTTRRCFTQQGEVVQDVMRVPGWFATVRTDLPRNEPARVLGCVRSQYKPIQNSEAFGIADALLGEGVQFETAGSLRNGKITWMLTKKIDSLAIKDDKVDQYLLITNAHDGTRALRILFTPIRVVCMNTLRWAMAGAANSVKIRHIGNVANQVAEARHVLGLADVYFSRYAVMANALTEIKVSDMFATEYVEDLWPMSESKAGITRATKDRDAVLSLFHGRQLGNDMDAIRGTAWGLLNAIGQYVDHMVPTNTRGRTSQEASFERVMLKGDADFKDRAASLLFERTGITNRINELVGDAAN